MNTIHLAADTFSGVYTIDPSDYQDRKLQSPSDFYESLRSLNDGEIIFTAINAIDENWLDLINNEYGVKG
jgi:hypothetical protein